MMKFFIALTLLITGWTFSGFSQVVRGKITDAFTGRPLPDVTIMVRPGHAGTETGTDGTFILTPGKGSYLLEIRHVGYFPETRKINLKGIDTLQADFMLRTQVFEQEQVVVTATKTEKERSSVPLNVAVVSGEVIRRSDESNILPLLSSEVPGLFITERGVTGFGLSPGSAGKISIRGVGGSEASFPVLVLIDGQPQFMGLMGHPIPDSYVSGDIQKVEVVKGPASILYGSNAMGGAINLITRKPEKEGISLGGSISAGSYGTVKAGLHYGYQKKRLFFRESLQYDRTDGHRPSGGFRLFNGSFRAGYAINDHFSIDGLFQRSGFKAIDPGSIYATPADFANNSHWVDIVRYNTGLSFSNRFRKSEGGIKIYYLRGDHNLYDGWISRDENRGFSIYQGFRWFPGSLVSVGFDVKAYGGRATSPSLGSKSGKYLSEKENGAYLMVDQQFWGKLSLNAGIRWDHHSGFGNTWVPQFGTTYAFAKYTSAKVQISRGFRNPSIRELYFFPTANPDLLPEKMWNHELTWTQGLFRNRVVTEITGFMIRGDNIILLVPNQPAPPPMKNQNSGTFYHTGMEFTLKYSPSQPLRFSGNYSFLDTDKPRVSSPSHMLNLNGQYKYGKLSVSVNLRYIGDLITNTSVNAYASESFTLLGTRISFSLNRNVEFHVSGENLLDQSYQMQYGYPMPGATVFAGMNIKI